MSGELWSNAFLSNCSMIIHYMKETNEDLGQSAESVCDYNKNYILGISSLSASITQRYPIKIVFRWLLKHFYKLKTRFLISTGEHAYYVKAV